MINANDLKMFPDGEALAKKVQNGEMNLGQAAIEAVKSLKTDNEVQAHIADLRNKQDYTLQNILGQVNNFQMTKEEAQSELNKVRETDEEMVQRIAASLVREVNGGK